MRITKLCGFLGLRLLGRRILATWLCLLRTWAERTSPLSSPHGGQLRGRLNFRALNRRQQEELGRVFLPYHRFCPECGSQCCREPKVPFSGLDRILFGTNHTGLPSSGPEAGIGRRSFLSCFQGSYLHRKLKRFTGAPLPPGGQAEPGATFCPALADQGCVLPWGDRPAVCVFCVCPQILAEMDWPAYGRYVWGTIKYLTHLSLVLRAARSARRFSQTGPTA